MKIDTSLFDNIPIEFKEINHTDFDSSLYNVKPKEIIKPIDGYISDSLTKKLKLDIESSNTVVINAGVGQGKTTSILDIVKCYADKKDYIVVIAVPYKSLIKQYYDELLDIDVPEKRLFNMLNINHYIKQKDRSNQESEKPEEWGKLYDEEHIINDNFKISDYDIHILTVNALLGNSVESLFRASIKTQYFNKLLKYCESNNKKLVLLFDEIHASIHNFKEEFIFNLWNYQDLIHKNYIISATYNEASKEVIKYLSEFTERNIRIIESKRLINIKNQSDLFLNFYLKKDIEQEKSLYSLILKAIDAGKHFDILVYSKNLAKKIVNRNGLIGGLLYDRNISINKCFSDPIVNDDDSIIYDKEKINIGTKFSTGINIEHQDHIYIVLFPKDVNNDFVNNKGIFTMGVNSIIQALARQRKKGEIHLFTPLPLNIEEKSITKIYSKEQEKMLLKLFNRSKKFGGKLVSYSNINNQKEELIRTYSSLYKQVLPAIKKIKRYKRNEKLNRLLYPTQEIFNLNKGEKHLTKTFFGGNLPAFILWASTTNQFLNCRLKGINFLDAIFLTKENQYEELKSIVKEKIYENEVIEVDYMYERMKPYKKIELFVDYVYTKPIILDGKKAMKVDKESIVLDIIKILFFNSKEVSKQDALHYYLKSCIVNSYIAKNDGLDKYKLSQSKINLIESFNKWMRLVEVIESNIEHYKKHIYIDKLAEEAFNKEYDKIGFKNEITNLIKYDILLSTNTLPLKDRLRKSETHTKTREKIFVLTVKTFFNNGENKEPATIERGKTNVYKVTNFSKEKIPNFLFEDLPEEIL
ncbi:MAG: hypothetical protein ACTJGD_02690 [Mesonia hippocampi]|uniref:hypothetical protein n=1 Tax=Mesonia hippocampi TaxID=1628250 RepID=UPI003F9469C5